MSKTIACLLVLVLSLAACGATAPDAPCETPAPVPAQATDAPLVCVTQSTACTSSGDPYKNAGCWDLRTCNRAPVPADGLTMACVSVPSGSDVPRFFCTWAM